MTAIAGYWSIAARGAAAPPCGKMLRAMAMYGGDGESMCDLGDIALGTTRRLLLPEDRWLAHDVAAAELPFTLIADVRLDNREELCEALQLRASDHTALADASLVLRAWARWEEGCFDRLAGDYAFALWDHRARRLVLARDHIGGRPLHYHRGQGFFAFASMPKGLHALADIPYAPDETRIAEFLALMPEAGSRSFFQDISCIEPGHFAVIGPNGIATHRHWSPEPARLKLPSLDDYAEGLREQLDRAVKARLRRAQGGVGAHLSAGLDSSVVMTSAARQMGPDDGGLIAFTSVPRPGYDGPEVTRLLGDEGDHAAATAALHANVTHVRIPADGKSPIDDYDRDYDLFDRPLNNGDVQHFWKQINAAAQARDVGVLLTALHGNQTVSYDGSEYLGELGRSLRLLRLASVGRRMIAAGHITWKGLLVEAFGHVAPGPLWVAANKRRTGIRFALDGYSAVNPNRVKALDLHARASALGHDFHYRPKADSIAGRLWSLRRTDMGNIYKGVLAGWGVDMRDPMSDRRLIEYCLSIPAEVFMHDGEPRALARHAFADRLPLPLLQERRRGQQSVDWHEALVADRARIAEEIGRLANVPAAASALDLERLDRLVTQTWPTEGWESLAVMSDYRFAMMRGVASGHFLRRASRSNA